MSCGVLLPIPPHETIVIHPNAPLRIRTWSEWAAIDRDRQIDELRNQGRESGRHFYPKDYHWCFRSGHLNVLVAYRGCRYTLKALFANDEHRRLGAGRDMPILAMQLPVKRRYFVPQAQNDR